MLKQVKLFFTTVLPISDSTRSITGGKMAYDETSGIIQVEENGKMVDSVNKVIVLGDGLLIE